MAKRPDISDFDYGSVVDQIRGQTRRRRPSFLKRNSGRIIDTLIGITDNYQTYKLREKMDNANFENNLELAKLRAEGNKFSKRAKETAPQYEALVTNGYKFGKEFEGSETNLNAARTVFGQQAWNNIVNNWSHALPKATLPTYEEYEKQRANWGIDEEHHKNIEKYYNAYVKEQAKYVESGQAFDFDQFNTNLQSLQQMDINIDPDNYGLLKKIGGQLDRQITYRDEQRDLFATRYLTSAVDKATNAMDIWKESKTPEEYLTAIQDVDVGMWSALGDERASLLASLDGNTKTTVVNNMQKVYGSRKNISLSEFRDSFDDLLYEGKTPTESRARLITLEANELFELENNINLTDIQKKKRSAAVVQKYDLLSDQFGDLAPDDLSKVLSTKRVLENVEAAISPLITLKEEGKASPEELSTLDRLERNRVSLTSVLETVNTVDAAAAALLQEAQNNAKFSRVLGVGKAAISSHIASNTPEQKTKGRASTVLLETDVPQIIESHGIRDEQTATYIASKASKFIPWEQASTQSGVVTASISRFTSAAKETLQEAIENAEYRENNFPNKTVEELEFLLDKLALNAANDPQGKKLSQVQAGITAFQYTFDQYMRINQEQVDKGFNGYFHGMGNPSQFEQNTILMGILVNENLKIDQEDKLYITGADPKTVLDSINRSMQNLASTDPARTGSVSVNTSIEEIRAYAEQSDIQGFGNGDALREEANRREQELQQRLKEQAEAKAEEERALEASRAAPKPPRSLSTEGKKAYQRTADPDAIYRFLTYRKPQPQRKEDN